MRIAIRIAIFVLLTTAAVAQPRPVIESIEPGSGSPAGGTTVTIRGKNLAPFISPLLAPKPQCTPCPAKPTVVLFGGKAAVVQSYAPDVVVVKTPPNAGGFYDVQVDNTYLGPANPAVLPRAFQYGTNPYDRVLVPVIADHIPGAFGSIWTTELVGRNDNDRNVFVTTYIPEIVALEPPPWTGGEAKSTFRPQFRANGAGFLYLEHVEDRPLAFNLRVRDLSRQSESWGTEVPLVRSEDAFVGRPMTMLNVPYEPESRITLRIYDLDGPTGGLVPVTVFHNETNLAIASTIVHLPEGAYTDTPSLPGYVELDPKSLPGLLIGVDRVRIQVGDVGLPKRLWAMVSVTDLETQQVTVITPQK